MAEGIVTLLEHPKAKNTDFNLSTSESTSVIELAQLIWKKIRKNDQYNFLFKDPFKFDVQKRVPSTMKAKKLWVLRQLQVLTLC